MTNEQITIIHEKAKVLSTSIVLLLSLLLVRIVLLAIRRFNEICEKVGKDENKA